MSRSFGDLPLKDPSAFGGQTGAKELVSVVPEITAEGCWAAKIVVTGTHTGAPYAPAPHLPKVAKTGRSVVIGPETFKLFVNAEGLVVRHEIEVHEPGKPAGPPGFYEGIGGVMLPPPA